MVIVVAGVYLIADRQLTLGALVAASMLGGRALAPAGQIAGLLMQWQSARTALEGLDKVMAHAKEIPTGTILLVVREDRPNKVTRVTHLGFVVQKKRRTYLRHAARNHYAEVVDEDLETFLLRNSKYTRWPVSGVALYEVRAPSEPLTAQARPGE